MSNLLEQIMEEFNAMPDNGSWEGDHPILKMAQHIDDLQKENNRLTKALKYIANPIKAIQEAAEEEGLKVDGMAAIRLSEDAEFLKSCAREALGNPDKQSKGNT